MKQEARTASCATAVALLLPAGPSAFDSRLFERTRSRSPLATRRLAAPGGVPAGLPLEVAPVAGIVYSEKGPLGEVSCKPKLLPIKSATLERLQALEADAARALAAQRRAATAMPQR